ncbi:transmembrane signal receptor [Lithospermum erythrorhizon]|uniref:Transmembrane signal receptor n=1 Tax=Lithospermum erythrorhizon TaxID=34254 RepID=A0AAV3PMS5_LITER
MHKELAALEANDTWEVVDLPPNHKPIGCKWVFRLKYKQDGSVDKYKARLVAKGFNQIEGVGYFDSFSPVAKIVTVRIILAYVAANGWALHQLDINNAYLHGYLDEDIYMQIPEGYVGGQKSQVCKLKRSLYGLKQAGRQWNTEFTNTIIGYGFVQSYHDHCLFTLSRGMCFLVLVVYVDDILLTGNTEDEMIKVKGFLHERFTIKDLGLTQFFLGIEIHRTDTIMHLSHQKYIWDIIKDLHVETAKPTTTPLPSDWSTYNSESPPMADPSVYRRLAPSEANWTTATHVVNYLRGTISNGLTYATGGSSLSIQAYCDADWAKCPITRRSVSGYILQDIKQPCHLPLPLGCDNKSAIYIIENPIFHERTKHIELDCHLIRDHYKSGFIKPYYVPSKSQMADLFTKSLPAPLMFSLLSKMNFGSLHSS